MRRTAVRICRAAFSGNGRFLAIRLAQGRVCLLRTDTMAEVANLLMPDPPVSGLAFDATGRQLLVVSEARRVWDLAKVREMGKSSAAWAKWDDQFCIKAVIKRVHSDGSMTLAV